MVKYACAFSQLELGKYFEWIIKTFKGSKENDVPENEYVPFKTKAFEKKWDNTTSKTIWPVPVVF